MKKRRRKNHRLATGNTSFTLKLLSDLQISSDLRFSFRQISDLPLSVVSHLLLALFLFNLFASYFFPLFLSLADLLRWLHSVISISQLLFFFFHNRLGGWEKINVLLVQRGSGLAYVFSFFYCGLVGFLLIIIIIEVCALKFKK